MNLERRLEALENRQGNNPGVVVVFEGTPGAEEDLRQAQEQGRTVLIVKFVKAKPRALYT